MFNNNIIFGVKNDNINVTQLSSFPDLKQKIFKYIIIISNHNVIQFIYSCSLCNEIITYNNYNEGKYIFDKHLGLCKNCNNIFNKI